ncbi:MAG: endonuclease domain-containing protein [Hyphomicrobiaceae bacterium]|jgi:very-short-patch-repair endonuclease
MRRAQPWRTNRARVLRSKSSSAEDRLWSRLRNRNFAGLKFTRQAPVGPYFVDFLCRDRKIIVEVDGGTHGTAAEISHDERRATELRQLGYRVFRACNIDVYENIDGVLDTLLAFIEKKSS